MSNFKQSDDGRYFGAIAAIIGIFLLLGMLSKSYAHECLPSAPAVWSAHPGSWATWSTVGNHRCYFVGRKHGHVAQLVEQRPLKAKVAGSNPAVAAILDTGADDYAAVNMPRVPLPRARPIADRDLSALMELFGAKTPTVLIDNAFADIERR